MVPSRRLGDRDGGTASPQSRRSGAGPFRDAFTIARSCGKLYRFHSPGRFNAAKVVDRRPTPVGPRPAVLPRFPLTRAASSMASIIPIQEAQGPFFCGVDVGGTNIKMGVVDDLGRRCACRQIPTDERQGPESAMRRAAEALRSMTDQLGLPFEEVSAVGLATPGTMDIARGLLLQPHNLPSWWDFPIRDCLSQASGKPVWFANDANAAAFGEFWVGSGSEFHSIALFTLGTGVGGGVIIGELSIDGENSAGSEVGHTIIDYRPEARQCGCGKRGHLEAYASGKAVVQRALEGLAEDSTSSLRGRLEQVGELTPLTVAQEAEAGDALALRLVMDTAMYLGVGAVNVMHIIDPGAVIFGGAMDFGGQTSPLGRRFLERVRQEIAARAFPVLAEKTQIKFASLGNDAGFIGVAGVARLGFRRPSM
jgi:glucokinase